MSKIAAFGALDGEHRQKAGTNKEVSFSHGKINNQTKKQQHTCFFSI
jgi:hypothetical protein